MKAIALIAILLLLTWFPKYLSRIESSKRKRLGKAAISAGLTVAFLLSIRLFGLWGGAVAAALFSLFKGAHWGRRWYQGPGASPRVGDDFRRTERRNGMTAKEAREVLGVAEGASRAEILANYRNLMKKVHPDTPGGSEYLASRVNAAKDTLLP